jgi:hypothetical protein
MSTESENVRSTINGSEEAKEWYVLFGKSNEILKSAYVKELHESGKVRIKGAYSRSEILNYYHNNMINNNTVLFKKGDSEWKPFSAHNMVKVPAIPTAVSDEVPDISLGIYEDKSYLLQSITKVVHLFRTISTYAWSNKFASLSCIVAILLGGCVYYYYHYSTAQIYNRVKQNVVLISSDYSVGSTQSIGSGFIVDEEGLVVTNLHVIYGLNAVRIKAGNNQTYEAEGVLYFDAKNDLALLKMKKTDKSFWDAIEMGKPEELEIGERVYAVGNPAGMEFSLSEGIVSGKRTEDPIKNEARKLIQITAPISPGNSGGPVLDKKGRVVGVATLGSKNEFQNINFAVPINLLGDYKKYKDIKYRFLSTKPDWISLNVDNSNSQNQASDNSGLDLVNAFYDKKSITILGDNRRVWFKTRMVRHKDYINYNHDIIALIEMSCTKKLYRYNIVIGIVDNDESSMRIGFFEDNDWKHIDESDDTMLEKVCKLK